MERVAPPPVESAPDGTAPDRSGGLRRFSRRALVFGLALVVMVVVASVVLWRVADDRPAPLTAADVDRAVRSGIEKALEEQRGAPPDAVAAYLKILPSLVTITTGGVSPAPGSSAPASPAPTGPASETGPATLGAGVVVNAEGLVLTALHVVDGAAPVRVLFADGTLATATVAVRQPANDIAVLAVDRLPQIVVPAVMGGGAQVGDAVFPVGHPLGLRGTLSAGVVSALDRTIRAENDRPLAGLIQFDAAVNPGSSGGPLLDRNGQVIGIVTALANPTEQPYFVGVGFAVPIAAAGGAAGGPRQ